MIGMSLDRARVPAPEENEFDGRSSSKGLPATGATNRRAYRYAARFSV
jgi:hypothetical protein